jgi:hypothetical protein
MYSLPKLVSWQFATYANFRGIRRNTIKSGLHETDCENISELIWSSCGLWSINKSRVLFDQLSKHLLKLKYSWRWWHKVYNDDDDYNDNSVRLILGLIVCKKKPQRFGSWFFTPQLWWQNTTPDTIITVAADIVTLFDAKQYITEFRLKICKNQGTKSFL